MAGLSRYVLVESKSHGPHGAADLALRGLGLRPVQISKYCLAGTLLYPGIRSNPWHRLLRRYFTDATHSAPAGAANAWAGELLRLAPSCRKPGADGGSG